MKRKFTMRKSGIEMTTVRVEMHLTREQVEMIQSLIGTEFSAKRSFSEVLYAIFSDAIYGKLEDIENERELEAKDKEYELVLEEDADEEKIRR